MSVHKEFSRFAREYGQYNIIQNKVAQKLIDDLSEKPNKMLDLGCGNGTIASKIDWLYTHFLGIDFSEKMLELHPQSTSMECRMGDFNEETFFESIQAQSFDRIFSASALQWAKDLDKTLYQIAQLQAPVSLALFTSNTFKTLLDTAGLESPLRGEDELRYLIGQYFHCELEVVQYELSFEKTEDIFTYIKRSGVSGGRNQLGFKQMKALMQSYPHDHLEFEVLFAQN